MASSSPVGFSREREVGAVVVAMMEYKGRSWNLVDGLELIWTDVGGEWSSLKDRGLTRNGKGKKPFG